MLPVRHLRSVLMLLIVKTAAGLILKPNIYQLEQQYEDYSADGDEPFIVIVIKDDYTDDYDMVYRSKERKGMSIEYTPQNTTKVIVKAEVKKELEPTKGDSDENENKGSFRDFDGLKLTRQQKDMLRKKWRSSCDKKAAKVCRKACVAAVKNVCRGYRCKKGMKGKFRKECKVSCKSKFLGIKPSKGSDSD